MNKAIVLVNPTAGRGAATRVGALARDRLRTDGYEVEVVTTTGPGHATEVARATDAGRVVVVGGDGTLREVAEASLERSSTPFEVGFVPMGNANVVARELGIPLEPSAALDVLDTAAVRAIDVGVASGRPFLAMVGVGYDAWVARHVGRARVGGIGRVLYRWWGDGVYGVFGAAGLCVPFARRLEVTVDGEAVANDAASAIVCNTGTYAKGWSVTPDARIDDGLLDVCVARFRGPWRTLRWLYAQATGRRFAGPDVIYAAAARLRIESPTGVPWQLDGDPMGETRALDVDVRAGALSMLVPAAPVRGITGI